jgi:hypothetical protein
MPAFPQSLGAGLKAGVPLSDAFRARSPGALVGFSSETKRYTVGPMIEVRLPFGLGIELDALYKSLEYRAAGLIEHGSLRAETTGNAWQFPLLLKYRTSGGMASASPYVAGGVAYQRLSGLAQFIETLTTGAGAPVTRTTDRPEELRKRANAGFVLGGGIEVKALFLRISPEIRYTRWGSDNFLDRNTSGDLLRSNRNQFEFLTGFSF